MDMKTARGFAAQAWCEKSTENKVMDADLADAFAGILIRRIDEAILSEKFVAARRQMAMALSEDDGLRQGYTANIAMLLSDKYGITDHDQRNRAAADILKLVFEHQ